MREWKYRHDPAGVKMQEWKYMDGDEHAYPLFYALTKR